MALTEGSPAPPFSLPDAEGSLHSLSDYAGKTLVRYGSTVIIGPDGSVLKHWKKVPNAAAHPEKVRAFLDACDA